MSMRSSRIATWCFVLVSAIAPLPAQAQGNSGASNLSARVQALEVAVAKLNGNITAADLEGTYNFYLVATAIDGGPNTIASYVITGTATLGSGGTGQLNVSAAGRELTEQAPNLNWLATSVSDAQTGNFSWTYSNGKLTIDASGDVNEFTTAAGGQVMVGVQGGPPGNNQIIFVLTRQP
jgi:hypothetical protein